MFTSFDCIDWCRRPCTCCTMMSYLTEDQLGRMFKLAEDTLSYDTLEQKQVTDDNLTASDARRLRASVGVERPSNVSVQAYNR